MVQFKPGHAAHIFLHPTVGGVCNPSAKACCASSFVGGALEMLLPLPLASSSSPVSIRKG